MKKCVICNKKIKDGEEEKELFDGKKTHKSCFDSEINKPKSDSLLSFDYYDGDKVGLKNDMFVLGYDDFTTSEEHYNYCNIIRGYHSRDLQLNFKSAKDEETNEHTLYYGFELETEWGEYNHEHKEKVVHYIRKKYRHFDLVFETDGSLNNGIEIISQPMTLLYIEENKQDFIDLLNYISEQGGTSHDGGTCGLHFHVSRQGLGNTKEEQEELIDKLLLFIEFYKEDIKKFSRRERWNYCRILSDDMTLTNQKYFKSEKVLEELKKNGNTEGHNTALNTEGHDTIEFRFVRGTLNPTTFFASLYLFDNMIQVFKTFSLGSKKISFDKVVKYNHHAELIEYCNNKNIFNSNILQSETYNILRELKAKETLLKRYTKDNSQKAKALFQEIQKSHIKYARLMLQEPTSRKYKNIYDTNISLLERTSDNKHLLNKEIINNESILEKINANPSNLTRDLKNYISRIIDTIRYSDFESTEEGQRLKTMCNEFVAQLNERGQE